jgi:hypothetical protein
VFVVPQHLLDEVEFETYQRRDHLVQAMVTQILRLGGCDPAADLAGSPRSPVTAAAAAVTAMEAPEPEPEGADAADDVFLACRTGESSARDAQQLQVALQIPQAGLLAELPPQGIRTVVVMLRDDEAALLKQEADPYVHAQLAPAARACCLSFECC